MSVNIPGIISVIGFYLVVLVIGICAGRKTARSSQVEGIFLADRNLGLIVSFFTLTATMVGGAFINGTAEIMASQGFLWTQAPIGYCVALFIGGMVYGPKMRRAGYVTMFDPFQEKYGLRVGAILCISQFLGDLFWTAAVLSALGSTIAIIVDWDQTMSVIVSACVAISYTVLGGLWSVAYTDVVQLLCIALGLFLAFPFALEHPAVDLSRIEDTWVGHLETKQIGVFIDIYGLLMMGGIPWQVYYQRILACKTPFRAKISSMVAAVFCLVFAIPPSIMGLAASAADWNQTSYEGPGYIPKDQMGFVLPLTLQYLCPPAVSIIGLGAVSAAVMSSADSSILATASVFTNNVYRNVFRQKASDRELIWILRISTIVAGTLSTVIAVTVKSVYGLYVLCSDLMYVILFPQFTCVLFVKITNTYGGIFGFALAFVLRVFSGEPLIGLPTFIKFPFYDENEGQLFPFRTFIMACSFLSTVLVSILLKYIFKRKWIPDRYDVFGCFTTESEDGVEEENKRILPGMRPMEKATRKQSDGALPEPETIPLKETT
ncbi:high-affinity choline transporter 1-like [Gigantopelta aegis]|uniref:high-affinity choline transporter 1-like n=1 Tax=Gigantopelta aegis TaxID=1735272 RepID=UPI001B889A3D|nr:high-affinity choline transporter 1-like [Gigantopelta aegis]